MRKLGELCLVVVVAVYALLISGSIVSAADRMDDWVGQNTNSSNQFGNGQSLYAPDNNYGIISATSVGGQVQSKINFSAADDLPEPAIPNLDTPFIFLADQALEGPVLSFASELHMTGTITFNSPQATEPNFCFCWYSSENTNHRVGLGISNRSVAQGGAVENALRMDFGYAAGGGTPSQNRFYFASTDGSQPPENLGSVLPNGTYQFSFDYVPEETGPGGTMSLTVGDYFKTVAPLETQPWDVSFFELDRFGIIQRSTGNTTQLGFYNVTFSNVTYTGGTDAPAISGDHNSDGFVDAADYVAWRKDPAGHGGSPDGYDAFVAQFGQTVSGTGGIGGVPEPGSLILCFFGIATSVSSRCFSRRP